MPSPKSPEQECNHEIEIIRSGGSDANPLPCCKICNAIVVMTTNGRLSEKWWEEDFIEAGAALEHTRWSKWQQYLQGRKKKQSDGSLLIPPELVERWERQIKTDYTELTDTEKESDRKESRCYLHLISGVIAEASRRARLEERESIIKNLNEMVKINADATAPADDYHTGLTNGLECAAATLERREPHDHIGMSGEPELNAFAKEISKKNGTPRNVAYAGAGIEEYEATQAKLKEMRSATIKECIDKLESLKTRGLSWEDDIKNASLDHAILILSKLQGLMVE